MKTIPLFLLLISASAFAGAPIAAPVAPELRQEMSFLYLSGNIAQSAVHDASDPTAACYALGGFSSDMLRASQDLTAAHVSDDVLKLAADINRKNNLLAGYCVSGKQVKKGDSATAAKIIDDSHAQLAQVYCKVVEQRECPNDK